MGLILAIGLVICLMVNIYFCAIGTQSSWSSTLFFAVALIVECGRQFFTKK
jgi:hypothetical protein